MSFQQLITQQIELDIGHRIMHEEVQCFSIHGHRVKIELHFLFTALQEIGYYIDFKEIKRIGGQWLREKLDHGFIANPHDTTMLTACRETGSKIYLMSLNGRNKYCNPTAENISREIFMAMEILFQAFSALEIHQIRYYETPNCWVDTFRTSLPEQERKNFYEERYQEIREYAIAKGCKEYDIRKSNLS